MKTEKEIRKQIKEVEKNYEHVLTGSMATVFENAPRALMQLLATGILDGLFWAIGEERPKYGFEKKGKK